MERPVVLLLLLPALAVAQWAPPLHQRPNADCPRCDLSACRTLDCPAGEFYPGPCVCCPVCALGEGSFCYNKTIRSLPQPPSDKVIVPCGENLECLLRRDLDPRDAQEALCTCKQTEPVCGTNDQTYENICQLREAAIRGDNRRGPLAMRNWGPCQSVPEITGAPDDSFGPLSSDMSLSCEAKGNPIPDLHWEFRGDDGHRKNLPSDDQSVSVQVRGGPDAYMITSWVQIMNLQANYTGSYTCVATNAVGVTRAEAKVGVYNI